MATDRGSARMMFFLARSALCIGAVAAAAGGLGGEGLVTAADRGARQVAADAGRACLASSTCLRVGTAALSAAGGASPVTDPGASVAAPAGPRRRAPARRAGAEPNRTAAPPGG